MSKSKRRARRNPKIHRPPDRAANPIIPWLHGLAAMGDERWEEAIPALQRFLEMADQPEDRRTAYQNLAACYLALERYDQALAALDEAEGYAPDDPDTVHSRGVTYACAARLPEAIAAFELYAHRWPKRARRQEIRPLIRQLRRAERGKIPPEAYRVDHLQEQVGDNLELGDYERVEQKARRMMAADPDRPEGHFALGVACLQQDRYAEALDAFLGSHDRDPKYAPTLYNIGHTYLKLGQPEPALAWLERARRRDPQPLATLHQLGLACERLGRREEAVAWWRKALRLDPDYHPARQRLYEVGQGPEPAEPPLSPAGRQLKRMMPVVKARMKRPVVHRNEGLTLTYDGQVGFVLEDRENAHNATIYAGGPFHVAQIGDEDLLDLIGLVKLTLRMINVENTRDVAVLVYYADRPAFNYQARFERGKRVEFDAHGQFVVTQVPRFFKLRIDSDLATPYGNPMQGKLIYLNQPPEPGFLVSTLGIGSP